MEHGKDTEEGKVNEEKKDEANNANSSPGKRL